jgi:signal transduction histidine kinase
MGEIRTRIFLMFLNMAGMTATATVGVFYLLYRGAVREEGVRLQEAAQLQGRILETISLWEGKKPWKKVLEAQGAFRGFGRTGEFVLARREGDRIAFYLPGRGKDGFPHRTLSFDSPVAEPIRWALSGRSGVAPCVDIDGKKVLAAYQPLPSLSLGITAKKELAEIRAPFVRAGVWAGAWTAAALLAGAIAFLLLINPLLVRLAEDEKELLRATERERQRLSRELHENLGQDLTAVSYSLGLLQAGLSSGKPPPPGVAAETARLVEGAIERARGFAGDLFPVSLNERDLLASLEELAARTNRLHGISCRVVLEGPEPPPRPAVDIQLYRIAQEAVDNAVVHGRANGIVITLSNRDDGQTLRVRDDGVGLPPPDRRGPGMGQRIMAYRARAIGARLAFDNIPPRGAEVSCILLTHPRPRRGPLPG